MGGEVPVLVHSVGQEGERAREKVLRARARWAECWASVHEALGSGLRATYTRHGGVCLNPSTWLVEAAGSGVQHYPWPHSQFKASRRASKMSEQKRVLTTTPET